MALLGLLEWSDRMGMEPDFLRMQTGCSFIPTLRHGGGKYYPISLRTSGYLILQMRFLVTKAPFDTPEAQEALLRRLNSIPGVVVPVDRIRGMPSIPLGAMSEEATRTGLLEALGWMVEQIRST